eukprot:comp24124_c0_seq2/m.43765 comp24124_c0_seq2/g.43765  ORF comp24124_c0_seq2/g.43765 comp24124_c0_seq2/m.43765 type:complete len:870 (-) comp24124_c0_seq2:278-2887(-)
MADPDVKPRVPTIIENVQELLHKPERVLFALEATNLRGKTAVDQFRTLALVTSEASDCTEKAIFSYVGRGRDLTLEHIIPIYNGFVLVQGRDLLNGVASPETPNGAGEINDLEFPLVLTRGSLLVRPLNAVAEADFLALLNACIEEAGEESEGAFLWVFAYQCLSTMSEYFYANHIEEPEPADVELGGGLLEEPDEQIANEFIAKMLRNRRDEYSDKKKIRVFCGTFNVNGKMPDQSLKPWLEETNQDPPDIYALGFQELDLSAQAFLLNGSVREDYWAQAVEEALSKKGKYLKVRSQQLVGMLLMVYVHESLVPNIRDCDAAMCGVGIMGVMGNKGAVVIRLRLFNTTLCFLNCHLAADSQNWQKRNMDYMEIGRRIEFNPTLPPENWRGPYVPERLKITKHDYVFWLGDLNYRVNMDNDTARSLIVAGELSALLKYDQLTIERGRGTVFKGYKEGEITFPPTYKFDVGTHNYDSSEKQRVPSWTDRILYMGDSVDQISYRSHPQITCSDHKPVSAVFTIQAYMFDADRQNTVYKSILAENDKLKNQTLPRAKVSSNTVDFGDVTYRIRATRSIVLENTGLVTCRWRFVPGMDPRMIHKPWLHIEPLSGMIEKGEKETIRFNVLVGDKAAASIQSGQDPLSDILVLYLEGSQRIFVEVTGHLRPTPFGMPLEKLLENTGAVRSNQIQMGSPQRKRRIPVEMWRLIDWLEKHALDTPDLFLTPGEPAEMLDIYECLATGDMFEDKGYQPHSVAHTLLNFLQALPDPVIPMRLAQDAVDRSNNPAMCKELVARSLPVQHYNAFTTLIRFARTLLEPSHRHNNQLTPEKLAVELGKVMIHLPRSQVQNEERVDQKRKFTFIFNFLVDPSMI